MPRANSINCRAPAKFTRAYFAKIERQKRASRGMRGQVFFVAVIDAKTKSHTMKKNAIKHNHRAKQIATRKNCQALWKTTPYLRLEMRN
jgi:hypothetical protein